MERIQCPQCGETVAALASRCKHCRAPLAPASIEPAVLPRPTAQAATNIETTDAARSKPRAAWVMPVFVIAVFLLGVCAGVLYEQHRASQTQQQTSTGPSSSNQPRAIPDTMGTNPR